MKFVIDYSATTEHKDCHRATHCVEAESADAVKAFVRLRAWAALCAGKSHFPLQGEEGDDEYDLQVHDVWQAVSTQRLVSIRQQATLRNMACPEVSPFQGQDYLARGMKAEPLEDWFQRRAVQPTVLELM